MINPFSNRNRDAITSRELFDAGSELCRSGHFDEALEKYARASKLSLKDGLTESWLVLREMTECLVRLRRFEEAEVQSMKLLKTNFPTDGLDSFSATHGRILLELGRFDEASKWYRHAINEGERKAFEYLHVSGKYDYEFALEDGEIIRAALYSFFMVNDLATADHLIEFLCVHQSEVGEFGEQLAFGLFLDEGQTMENFIAKVLFEIAFAHTEVNFNPLKMYVRMPFESCTHCLRMSIQLDPQPETFAQLGRHLEESSPQDAVDVYRQMETKFPSAFDIDTARSFGWALQELGFIDEAEKWLKRSALDYDPTDFFELEPLITFYGQCKRWNDAKEILEKYISTQMFKPDVLSGFHGEWAWELHARCCEQLGDRQSAATSDRMAALHQENRLRQDISLGRGNDVLNSYNLGVCLFKQGRIAESEPLLRAAKSGFINSTRGLTAKNRWWGHHWLGIYHEEFDELEEAEFHIRAAHQLDVGLASSASAALGRVLFKLERYEESEMKFREALDSSSSSDSSYWLGKCLIAQKRFSEAEEILKALPDDPYSTSSRVQEALDECRRELSESNSPPEFHHFLEFVEQGKFWIDSAHWSSSQAGILEDLFENGSKWADPNYVFFTDFDVSDSDLDDSLARAVAISGQIHLMPEMPVRLHTEKLEIQLDLDNSLLRAWVGRQNVGIAVTVDVSTWDLYYAVGDRDAMFATAAAINWFLDCSIALRDHPKFRRLSTNEMMNPHGAGYSGDVWTTQTGFDSDIENIMSGHLPNPPKAHRVRGHIRRLADGSPTEDARDNAPPYVRRHMRADETWVRGHSRGGDFTGANILTRLQSYSSLGDFLAMARRG